MKSNLPEMTRQKGITLGRALAVSRWLTESSVRSVSKRFPSVPQTILPRSLNHRTVVRYLPLNSNIKCFENPASKKIDSTKH